MTKLTHFNKSGEAHMVDVGDKAISHRIAVTEGRIRMQPETLALIEGGGHKKGDVLGIARAAERNGAVLHENAGVQGSGFPIEALNSNRPAPGVWATANVLTVQNRLNPKASPLTNPAPSPKNCHA